MRLPRTNIFIENVNLLYIDIQKIIQLSQTDRRAKIDGYLSVIYPGTQDIIFFRKGEMGSWREELDEEQVHQIITMKLLPNHHLLSH